MHILEKYIRENKLNLQELAELLNYDAGNLSRIINGKLGISGNLAFKIKEKLNIEVEANQRPKRYTKNNNNRIEETSNFFNSARPVYNTPIQVPIVQTKAAAGYALRYMDDTYIENLPKTHISIEYDNGNYLVFEIDGDSMDDNSIRSIRSGDMVLCKELDKSFWNSKLHYNIYLFIIVYENSTIIKQITDHNPETGEITCHSFNPIYEDFKINLKDVHQLFYCMKLVERSIKL